MKHAFVATVAVTMLAHAWWLTQPAAEHTTVPYLPVAAVVLLAGVLAGATRRLKPLLLLDLLPAVFTSASLFLVVQPPGLPDLRPAVFGVVVAGSIGALVLAWRLSHSSWHWSAWSAVCLAAGMVAVAAELCLQALRGYVYYYDTHSPGLATLASWTNELTAVMLVSAALVACGSALGAVAGRTTMQ